MLGEVEDLAVETINSTTLLVSFNEPFSLLGVPILFYTIAAIPIDTMDIISSTNSTETSVHISLYNVCSKHELIVSGWNEVGEGQIAKALAVLYDGILPWHTFENTMCVLRMCNYIHICTKLVCFYLGMTETERSFFVA